jgi:hypothetical protein
MNYQKLRVLSRGKQTELHFRMSCINQKQILLKALHSNAQFPIYQKVCPKAHTILRNYLADLKEICFRNTRNN